MKPDPQLGDVVAFAAEVDRLAAQIIAMVTFDSGPEDPMSPKVIAMCLFARSISNFRSGVLLLQNDRIVEARILARCCFESLFAAVALAQEQGRFIELLEADDRASRKSRGEFLLEISDGPREDDGTLRAFLRDLGRKQSKRWRSTPKEIAKVGPLYKAYAYYAQMSADAGHITVESLIGRYTHNKTHRGQSITVIEPEPSVKQEELKDTWFQLAETLLGICVYLGPILASLKIGSVIQPVLDRYKAFVRK